MKSFTTLVLITVLIFVSQVLSAQGGLLDNSFGNSGKLITTISANDDSYANAVGVQSDGKIVVAASNYNNTTSKYTIKIIRYLTDGTPDNSFGTSGIATITPGPGDDESPTGLGLQPDGKILVSGFVQFPAGYDFFLLRLNANGTMDNTFGTNGVVIKDLGDDEFANCMTIQSDGKILVAGSGGNGNDADFAVVRFNQDGTTDATFGSAGSKLVPMGTNTEDMAFAIKVQSNGKILMGGMSLNTIGFVRSTALVRLNADGSIDNTFGGTGKIVSNFQTGGDHISGLAIQSDGKIVACGVSDKATSDILLLRYTTTGTLDNTFGTGGVVISRFGLKDEQTYSVALQTDGKILVCGGVDSTTMDFALLRFTTAGASDNTFGTNGKVATDFAGDDEEAYAMTIQSNGKIILAGYSKYSIAVARYDATGPIVDAGLSNLIVPASICGAIGANQTVTLSLTNNGTNPISAAGASVTLSVTGANTGSFNASNTATLNGSASTTLTFSNINLSNVGITSFSATLTLAGDNTASNNTVAGKDTGFASKPVVSFTSTNTNNTYNFVSAVTGKAPLTYVWNFGDGSPVSTIPNPSHHYSMVGSYPVKLKCSDACGTDSSTTTINITTGIRNHDINNSITIYPNPSNDFILVNLPSTNRGNKIMIMDITGNILQEITPGNESELKINLSQLSEGVYFIRTNDEVRKFFVSHK